MTVRHERAIRDELRALIAALDAAARVDSGRRFLTTRFRIGGGHWRVHTGADSGAESMLDGCAPLRVRDADPAGLRLADFDLYVWNDAFDRVAPASLGMTAGAVTPLVPAGAPAPDHSPELTDLSGYSDAVNHAFWMPAAGVLSVIDIERRRAHWWLRDIARVPYYERAAPFRHILHWWMSARGGALLHTSAVCGTPRGGAPARGILITGPSGCGKSTTALACLAGGMQFTGDDYVLVDAATPPHAYMAYATSKIVRGDLGRQRAFAAHMLNLDRVDEKPMMFVDRFAPASICPSFAIEAMVMPQVVHAARTRFLPMSGAAMLRALAPSSMLLFPLAGAGALRRMGELCSQLPCYRAELADDARDVAQAFADFVADAGKRSLRAVA